MLSRACSWILIADESLLVVAQLGPLKGSLMEHDGFAKSEVSVARVVVCDAVDAHRGEEFAALQGLDRQMPRTPAALAGADGRNRRIVVRRVS